MDNQILMILGLAFAFIIVTYLVKSRKVKEPLAETGNLTDIMDSSLTESPKEPIVKAAALDAAANGPLQAPTKVNLNNPSGITEEELVVIAAAIKAFEGEEAVIQSINEVTQYSQPVRSISSRSNRNTNAWTSAARREYQNRL